MVPKQVSSWKTKTLRIHTWGEVQTEPLTVTFPWKMSSSLVLLDATGKSRLVSILTDNGNQNQKFWRVKCYISRVTRKELNKITSAQLQYSKSGSPSCIIIEQAKEMLSRFQDFKVTKCHRSANGVAHVLGQFSRRVFSSCFFVWRCPDLRVGSLGLWL